MTQGQMLVQPVLYAGCQQFQDTVSVDPCEPEILFKSPHDYHHLTKHCEGPCCFLQCNSTGVTLGGQGTLESGLPEQLTPTQLSKLQPPRGVSLKETDTTQRTQYFLDSPLETRKGFCFIWDTPLQCVGSAIALGFPIMRSVKLWKAEGGGG